MKGVLPAKSTALPMTEAPSTLIGSCRPKALMITWLDEASVPQLRPHYRSKRHLDYYLLAVLSNAGAALQDDTSRQDGSCLIIAQPPNFQFKHKRSTQLCL